MRLEGLTTEAGAGDARLGDRIVPAIVEGAGIQFDRQRGGRCIERDDKSVEQPQKAQRRQGVGASTAKGDAGDTSTSLKVPGHKADLQLERFEITREPSRAIGRARIATAIPAYLSAIGDMDIDRDRSLAVDPVERCDLFTSAHTVFEFECGRIARIALLVLRLSDIDGSVAAPHF